MSPLPAASWTLASTSVLVLTLFALPLFAQSAPAAEALFQEGKRLLKEGQTERACQAFKESNRLDVGVGTLYHLGLCYEALGRPASAWSAYLEAASLANAKGELKRVDAARAAADALEPALSHLTVKAPQPTPDGLVVTVGGVEIRPAAFDTSMPFDPGEHAVMAVAPGYISWKSKVLVSGQAQSVSLTVPQLVKEPTPPRVTAPVPSPKGGPLDPIDEQPTSPWFYSGIVAGGVGGAALVAGAVLLGVGVSQNAAVREEEERNYADACAMGVFTPSECSDPAHRQRELEPAVELRSSGLVIPGVVMLVGGAVVAGVGIAIAVGAGDDGDDGNGDDGNSATVALGWGYAELSLTF